MAWQQQENLQINSRRWYKWSFFFFGVCFIKTWGGFFMFNCLQLNLFEVFFEPRKNTVGNLSCFISHLKWSIFPHHLSFDGSIVRCHKLWAPKFSEPCCGTTASYWIIYANVGSCQNPGTQWVIKISFSFMKGTPFEASAYPLLFPVFGQGPMYICIWSWSNYRDFTRPHLKG